MLPFIIIVLILIGSVVGQIVFGNNDQATTDRQTSDDINSREHYRSRRA